MSFRVLSSVLLTELYQIFSPLLTESQSLPNSCLSVSLCVMKVNTSCKKKNKSSWIYCSFESTLWTIGDHFLSFALEDKGQTIKSRVDNLSHTQTTFLLPPFPWRMHWFRKTLKGFGGKTHTGNLRWCSNSRRIMGLIYVENKSSNSCLMLYKIF